MGSGIIPAAKAAWMKLTSGARGPDETNRLYYSDTGEAYDPLKHGSSYVVYDPGQNTWMSHGIASGGVGIQPDRYEWQSSPGQGTTHAALQANPDYQFLLNYGRSQAKANGRTQWEGFTPGQIQRYDSAPMTFDDYYSKRGGLSGTEDQILAATGLSPEQYRAYAGYASDKWLYDLYDTNPMLAQKIAPRPELGPAPDFSKPGYYRGSQYLGAPGVAPSSPFQRANPTGTLNNLLSGRTPSAGSLTSSSVADSGLRSLPGTTLDNVLRGYSTASAYDTYSGGNMLDRMMKNQMRASGYSR